jgi:hypothetical protein
MVCLIKRNICRALFIFIFITHISQGNAYCENPLIHILEAGCISTYYVINWGIVLPSACELQLFEKPVTELMGYWLPEYDIPGALKPYQYLPDPLPLGYCYEGAIPHCAHPGYYPKPTIKCSMDWMDPWMWDPSNPEYKEKWELENIIGFFCQAVPLGGYLTTTPDISLTQAQRYAGFGVYYLCPPGTFRDSCLGATVNDCEACPIGTYSAVGSTRATDCIVCDPTGTLNIGSPARSGYCTCKPGFYSPEDTWGVDKVIPECVECTAGNVCRGGTMGENQVHQIMPCYGGQFAPAGSSNCLYCPGNHITSTGASSNEDCIECGAGKIISQDKTTCDSCPPGLSVWYGICQPCPQGFIEDSGVCNPCPGGEYRNAQDNTCYSCAVNTFSGEGESDNSCAPCVSGAHTNGNGGQAVCNFCALGYKWAPGGFCTICPAGTISTAGIQENMGCVAITEGKTISVAGSTIKIPCPYETGQLIYATEAEQTAWVGITDHMHSRCIACGVNEVVLEDGELYTCKCLEGYSGSPCQKCIAGTFVGPDKTCLPCPIGSYTVSDAAVDCTKCTDGKTTYGTGSTSDAMCVAMVCDACENAVDSTLPPAFAPPDLAFASNAICVMGSAETPGAICTDVQNTLIGGTCPVNWYSDVQTVQEQGVDIETGYVPRKIVLSPDGVYFALMSGKAPSEGGAPVMKISIHRFGGSDVDLSNVIIGGSNGLRAVSFPGESYEDLLWSTDSKYVLGFAREYFIVDRYSVDDDSWTDAITIEPSAGTDLVPKIEGVGSLWIDDFYRKGTTAGYPKCGALGNNDVLCIYRARSVNNMETYRQMMVFMNIVSGEGYVSSGYMQTNNMDIYGYSFTTALQPLGSTGYHPQVDVYSVSYIAGRFQYLWHIIASTGVPDLESLYTYYNPFTLNGHVYDRYTDGDLYDSSESYKLYMKMKASPRLVKNPTTLISYRVIYIYSPYDGWSSTESGNEAVIESSVLSPFSTNEGSEPIYDWDFLPNGEMVFITINSIKKLKMCHPCRGQIDVYGTLYDAMTTVSIGLQNGPESCGCPDGQFDNGFFCSLCSTLPEGSYYTSQCTRTSDSVSDVCSTCLKGYYIKASCTSNSDTVCNLCSPCNWGDYKEVECDGLGYVSTPICAKCRACSVGYYIDGYFRDQCNGNGNSKTIPVPYCKSCEKGCSSGEYISNQCDGKTSIVSIDGVYSEGVGNTQQCVSCPACNNGEYYVHGCSGKELDNIHVCAACSTCADGEYISDVNGCDGRGIVKSSYSCRRCLLCDPGFVHTEKCDGKGFSEDCTACPSCSTGYYIDNTADICTCTLCKDGQDCSIYHYKSGATCTGTSTSDISCTSCANCGVDAYKSTFCTGIPYVTNIHPFVPHSRIVYRPWSLNICYPFVIRDANPNPTRRFWCF